MKGLFLPQCGVLRMNCLEVTRYPPPWPQETCLYGLACGHIRVKVSGCMCPFLSPNIVLGALRWPPEPVATSAQTALSSHGTLRMWAHPFLPSFLERWLVPLHTGPCFLSHCALAQEGQFIDSLGLGKTRMSHWIVLWVPLSLGTPVLPIICWRPSSSLWASLGVEIIFIPVSPVKSWSPEVK
jgi:hypothetical protein